MADLQLLAAERKRREGRAGGRACAAPAGDVCLASLDAVARTMPLGSFGFEREANERGERLIWLRGHDPKAGVKGETWGGET